RRHTRFSRDWSSDVCSSDLGAVGTPFEHELTAEGDPAPTVTLDEADLPGGLSFDGTHISGTPTDEGTFTVPVTASNGVSPDAVQDLEIEILERLAGPAIERAPGQGSLTNAEPIVFTVTFPEAASGFSASDVQI